MTDGQTYADQPAQVITGVAPVQPVAPAVPRRLIGADAEAALLERHRKAAGMHLIYVFRGKEYRLLTPMPAAFMIHAGQIQNGDETDMREFVSAIRSAFVGEDGDKLVAELLDTKAEVPADAEYVSQVLSDIVEAVSDRPSTK